jgi:spore germination cell wall hydrolase CwlJ-like protein
LHKTIFLIITTIIFSITTIVLANNNSLFPIRVTADHLTNKAKAEVECLADNIFFEAGYEPIEGQRAVGIVTLNRVRSGQFENTICSVVKERNHRTCQFSWYCQDRERSMAYNKERLLSNGQKDTYEKVYNVALDLYVNSHTIKDNTGGALFYHADYVNPKWNHLNRTVKIGSHIFYKHGEKYAHQHDAKIKSRIENERQFVAFVLPSNGGY